MKDLELWRIELAVEAVIAKHEHEIFIESTRKAIASHPMLGMMYSVQLVHMCAAQANRFKAVVAKAKAASTESKSPTPSQTLTIEGLTPYTIITGVDLIRMLEGINWIDIR